MERMRICVRGIWRNRRGWVARVALVTGGTRGIGRAIVERLKADGMQVAAGYSGNDTAAEACAKELGVMVIKGNVGNFADCMHARMAVERDPRNAAGVPSTKGLL